MSAVLVYIPQINPKTYLHFWESGDSYCLRDYSDPNKSEPSERRQSDKDGYTVEEIHRLIDASGHSPIKPKEDESFKKYGYWHRLTVEVNERHLTVQMQDRSDHPATTSEPPSSSVDSNPQAHRF